LRASTAVVAGANRSLVPAADEGFTGVLGAAIDIVTVEGNWSGNAVTCLADILQVAQISIITRSCIWRAYTTDEGLTRVVRTDVGIVTWKSEDAWDAGSPNTVVVRQTWVAVVAIGVIGKVDAGELRVAGIVRAGIAVITIGRLSPGSAFAAHTCITDRTLVAVITRFAVCHKLASKNRVADVVRAEVVVTAFEGRSADALSICARPVCTGIRPTATLMLSSVALTVNAKVSLARRVLWTGEGEPYAKTTLATIVYGASVTVVAGAFVLRTPVVRGDRGDALEAVCKRANLALRKALPGNEAESIPEWIVTCTIGHAFVVGAFEVICAIEQGTGAKASLTKIIKGTGIAIVAWLSRLTRNRVRLGSIASDDVGCGIDIPTGKSHVTAYIKEGSCRVRSTSTHGGHKDPK